MRTPNEHTVYSGEVGALLVGQLRDYVEQCRFEGMDVEIWIGHGWFVKPFSIRGAKKDVESIAALLNEFIEEREERKAARRRVR